MDFDLKAFGKVLYSQLYKTLKSLQLDGIESTQFKQHQEQLIKFINGGLEQLHQPLLLAFEMEAISFNHTKLPRDNGKLFKRQQWLTFLFFSINIKEIWFHDSVNHTQMGTFFDQVLNARNHRTPLQGHIAGVIEIKNEPLFDKNRYSPAIQGKKEYILGFYATAEILVCDIVDRVSEGKNLELKGLKELFQELIDHLPIIKNQLIYLLQQPAFKFHLFTHLLNSGLWSILLGNALGLSPLTQLKLGIAGVFHDVGKIRIPNGILYKQEALYPEEKAVIKKIPRQSIDLLVNYFGGTESDVLTFLMIYENIFRDKSNTLGPFSNIITIASAYNAMTTDKPYRKAHTPDKALHILLHDELYERNMTITFYKMISSYPPGSGVLLNTGEIAIVRKLHHNYEQFLFPKVTIVTDKKGEIREEPKKLDLAEPINKRNIQYAVRLSDYGINPLYYL